MPGDCRRSVASLGYRSQRASWRQRYSCHQIVLRIARISRFTVLASVRVLRAPPDASAAQQGRGWHTRRIARSSSCVRAREAFQGLARARARVSTHPNSVAIEQPAWSPIAVCVLVNIATRVALAVYGEVVVPWRVCPRKA